MVPSKPPLTVILSPAARDDLWDIWGHNLEIYKSVDHADQYVAFLNTEINKLSTGYPDGNAIKGFPEFRFVTIRKSRRGHGHNAIYKIDDVEQIVLVLRVYHTYMDLEGRLKEEFH